MMRMNVQYVFLKKPGMKIGGCLLLAGFFYSAAA